jgi:hypothetical protein
MKPSPPRAPFARLSQKPSCGQSNPFEGLYFPGPFGDARIHSQSKQTNAKSWKPHLHKPTLVQLRSFLNSNCSNPSLLNRPTSSRYNHSREPDYLCDPRFVERTISYIHSDHHLVSVTSHELTTVNTSEHDALLVFSWRVLSFSSPKVSSLNTANHLALNSTLILHSRNHGLVQIPRQHRSIHKFDVFQDGHNTHTSTSCILDGILLLSALRLTIDL